MVTRLAQETRPTEGRQRLHGSAQVASGLRLQNRSTNLRTLWNNSALGEVLSKRKEGSPHLHQDQPNRERRVGA